MRGHRIGTAVWNMVNSSGRDGAGGKFIGRDSRYQSLRDYGEKANRLYSQDSIGITRKRRDRDLAACILCSQPYQFQGGGGRSAQGHPPVTPLGRIYSSTAGLTMLHC